MLAPTLEGPAPTTTYFADALQLTSSAKATAFAQISPELPVTLYGRGMKIAGAEL